MITRVPFLSPYIYSPQGVSETAARSRRLRDLVKRADSAVLRQIADLIAREVGQGRWPGVFGPHTTLVPIPGRAPVLPGGFWGPARIAEALQKAGLAGAVWPTLVRAHAIPKSAFAQRGERPTLRTHLDSLAVTDRLPPTPHIVLVDDFVTKGRTLLTAAQRLANDVPGLDISAFAVVRTLGLVPDIDRIWNPVQGDICEENGDAQRIP